MKLTVLLMSSLISFGAFAGEIEVKVSGMVCSMCAQGIKKKFSSRDEVKDLQVDLDQKIVLIETKPERDLEDKVITEIITEAGYNVASILRK